MPTLEKNSMPIKHLKGSKTASAVVYWRKSYDDVEADPKNALAKCFDEAVKNFIAEFGRPPVLDQLTITGAIVTLQVVVGIVEDPQGD